ncbi:MAG: chitobiase/beta-hexosaminidase C-terminal domain-containing protein, partial [Bacteroidales bacterium]|nr:chitobiase/beta-hexosaminidase C-terminal domain-containing protein [Bacteroidales bacterium]
STVKAKAWKEGMTASNISTNTYNFPVSVANIAEFKAANTTTSTTVYKITGDVTFVYENGSNMYIQDATGGLLIYDNQNVITNSYNEGDVISGGVVGTCSFYNGLRELVPSRDLAEESGNTGSVIPMTATVEDIVNEYDTYESRLVRLASVNFVDGGQFTTGTASNMEIDQYGETMVCRSNFKNLDMTINAGAEANVVGFVSIFSNNSGTDFQIFPRANADIELIQSEQVATPTFSPASGTYESQVEVTISCATEGAAIYYTLDGSEPDESANLYSAPITLNSSTTVKAIAIKEGWDDSEIASAAYQITTGISEVESATLIYPNPACQSLNIITTTAINHVEIYTMAGQKVSEQRCNGTQVSLNVSSLSAGMYFMKIYTEEGVSTQKFNIAR